MLLANGSYNGKSYKKEVISVEELMAGLRDKDKEMPILSYLRKPNVKITHPKNLVQLDGLNNNRIRRRASVTIPAHCILSDKRGNRCEIRYFEHEHFTENNVPVYEPRRLAIFQDEGMDATLDLGFNKEQSVFILLSPKNGDSPFNNDKEFTSFRILDTEKDNKALVDAEFEYLDTLSVIKELSKTNPDDLKRRAQGIRIGHSSIVGINFDDVPSVVVALNGMARQHPKEFISAFTDLGGTQTRGLIIDAFRKGILTYTIEQMQVVVSHKQVEMCRFNKNVDPATGVLDFVADNDIRMWSKKLTTDVADIDAEAKLKKNSNK